LKALGTNTVKVQSKRQPNDALRVNRYPISACATLHQQQTSPKARRVFAMMNTNLARKFPQHQRFGPRSWLIKLSRVQRTRVVSTRPALALQQGPTMSSHSRPQRVVTPIAPPAISLRGLDLRRAYVAAIAAEMSESRAQREITPKSPVTPCPKSLEALLLRASDLLARVSAADPRSRLLQSALLRRDHALLAAVVQSLGDTPVDLPRAALWSTSQRPRSIRAMQLHASERPTYRPPRRVAAE